jgi:general secretion pathway protein G
VKSRRLLKNARRGFTLVEILLVVVILAMIAAFAVPSLLGTQEQAQKDLASSSVKDFERHLKLYRLNNGAYPSSEQGLKSLVEKPEGEPVPKKWSAILEELSPDPWGNEYKYAFPGEKNGEKKPDIWSTGPDGQDGTDDDIGNWAKEGGGSEEEAPAESS